MKRFKVFFVMLLCMSLIISFMPTMVLAANPKPNVVPGLRTWTGGTGSFTVTSTTRIAVNTSYVAQLTSSANTFKEEIYSILGLNLPVVSTTSPASGDIFLTLLGTIDSSIGSEGYYLDIGSYVQIRANTKSGVFYGTQSVLQILKQNSSTKTLPIGNAKDYPAFGSRGIMIDAGRKYWSVDFIEDKIRQMAWHKLNTLHIHFNDWTAFRLKIDNENLALKALDDYAVSQGEVYDAAAIARIYNAAKKYNVTIIPEIDVPAHGVAKPYQDLYGFFDPYLSVNGWKGGRDGGWMFDITRSDVRGHISELFNYLIDTYFADDEVYPFIHIGGDEYDFNQTLTDDIMVNFISGLNDLIKSKGKKTKAWDWLLFCGQNDPPLPGDIEMDCWLSSTTPAYNNNPVIGCNKDLLYNTPAYYELWNEATCLNPVYIYESWTPSTGTNIKGYKICTWADEALKQSEEWFESYAKRGTEAFAEKIWGQKDSAAYSSFKTRVDAIGSAPGVPNWVDTPTTYSQVLKIDYFDNSRYNNSGINTLGYVTRDDNTLAEADISTYSEVKLRWSNNNAYWFTDLNDMDITPYQYLEIELRGAAGGERFNIELKDTNGVRSVVPVTNYAPMTNGATKYLKILKIPLSDFTGIDKTKISAIGLIFSVSGYSSGTIYVDNIELTRVGPVPHPAAFSPSINYNIMNIRSGMALDVYQGSTDNEANIIQWTYHGGNNQIWNLVPVSGGYYKIVNKKSGKAMDVYGGSTTDGARVIQYTYSGTDNQLWNVEYVGGGYYKIINKKSGKALDLNGGSTSDGANIIQKTYSGRTTQLWRIPQAP